MPDPAKPVPNRWQRFAEWDERPLRLDKFAVEDPANGFAAFKGAADPAPSLTIENGRVTVLDGTAEADFDMIDTFVARHHIDPAVAPEAMAIPSDDLARMLVDVNVPRTALTRLAHGMTPAKLADVVARLNAAEITFAYSKMRARKTPGNQGHVTNAKDDPLQLAADAATAVALGFDEVETTMRVSRNAWSNALACAVGAAVGRPGTLFQCASEEAEELRIAMAGFTSYAETVSVYGTEKAFVDGDDTPWSKAWLAAAYASRGVKMRCTSGRRLRTADGLPRGEVAALSRGALPLPAARHGRAGHAERRHRRRAARLHDSRRRARADGREPARRLARPRMRLGQRRPHLGKRDPHRSEDPALSDRRLGPHLLGLRHDQEIRQFLQPLALQRRRVGGLPCAPARLRGRRRADAARPRHGARPAPPGRRRARGRL